MTDDPSARYRSKTRHEHDALNLEAKPFLQANRFHEAAAIYERALAESPDDVGLMNNVAGTWNKCGRWDDAIELLGKAIAMRPDAYRLFVALGTAHWCKHQYVQAISAMQIPANWLEDFHMPKHNLGTLMLMHRKWEDGWWGHEYRFAAKGRGLRYKPELLWDGVTPQPQLTIWGEQGIGDEILQLGFADSLLDAFPHGDILWQIEPRLVALAQRSFPDIEFQPRIDRTYGELRGQHLPAQSLGRVFRQKTEDFPERASYLRSTRPGIVAGVDLRPRIGISWHSEKAQYAEWKSSPLKAWASLLSLPQYVFINLQYGNDDEVDAFPQVQTPRPLDRTNDIDGLARWVASCDLVVTVSNTVAHLACALGIPTIVLLNNKAILPWCWGVEDKTPWYPTAHVMRVAPDEDWGDLLVRVTREVEERLP